MADKLGEILVDVNEQGTEEAMQDVADASADAEGEGAIGQGDGQGAGGGGLAEMLGGIGTKLAAILGLVTFLASLKPIQEILSGLQRLFSAAILPLVSLLLTLLRPVMQKLLRFIAGLDFDNLLRDLFTRFSNVLGESVEALIEAIPFVGNDTASRVGQDIQRNPSRILGPALTGATGSPFVSSIVRNLRNPQSGNQNDETTVNITGFREQSNTSMDQNATETFNKTLIGLGPGGQ